MKNMAIIGIGNLLMTDEGFGVHVIRFLERNFMFPPNCSLVDAGTAGIYLAPYFERADQAFVIDILDKEDEEPGTIFRFSHEDMTGRAIQTSMSPHQLGVLEILEICRLRERLPDRIDFFCVVPKRIGQGVELSPELKGIVPKVAEKIVSELKREGIEVKGA